MNTEPRTDADYVRAALQSAVGKGLKFPSPELEEYVADFLAKRVISYRLATSVDALVENTADK